VGYFEIDIGVQEQTTEVREDIALFLSPLGLDITMSARVLFSTFSWAFLLFCFEFWAF